MLFFNVLSIKVWITETSNGFTCGCANNNNYYSSAITTKHNIVHCTVAHMLLLYCYQRISIFFYLISDCTTWETRFLVEKFINRPKDKNQWHVKYDLLYFYVGDFYYKKQSPRNLIGTLRNYARSTCEWGRALSP